MADLKRCVSLLQQLGSQVTVDGYDAVATQDLSAQLEAALQASNRDDRVAFLAQEGAAQAVVAVLATVVRNGDSHATSNVLKGVRWLCTDTGDYDGRIEPNLRFLATCGAVEAIVQTFATLLQALPQQPALQGAVCAGCEAIAGLAYDDANGTKMGTMGVCGMMGNLLTVSAEPAPTRAACAALKELFCVGENNLQFAQAGGCQLLLQKVIDHARPNPPAAVDLCTVLSYLLKHAESQVLLVRLGAIPAIMRLIRECADIPSVLAEVCGMTLQLCSGNRAVATQLGEAGMCTSLVQALDQHPNNAQVAVEACGTLVNLCDIEENRARTGVAGGGAAALRAFVTFQQDPNLARQASRLLRQLSLNDDFARAHLVLDGVAIATGVLEQHLRVWSVVEPLGWVFWKYAKLDSDANIRAWGPRVFSLFNQVLQLHLDKPMALASACVAMALIVGEEDGGVRLQTVGEVSTYANLLIALGIHREDEHVVHTSCRAIAALCRHEEHVRQFLQAGIRDVLLQATAATVQLEQARDVQRTVPMGLATIIGVWGRLCVSREISAFLAGSPQIVGIIRGMLQRYMVADPATVAIMCEAIACFANANEQLSVMCGTTGCCESITEALAHYSDNTYLVWSIVQAMGSLCAVPAHQDTFAQLGACQIVVEALLRCIDDREASVQCIRTMLLLSHNHQHNAELLRRANACEILVQALSRCMTDSRHARFTCTLLGVLAADDPASIDALHRMGFSEILARCFAIHTGSLNVVRAAVGLLAILSKSRHAAQRAELRQVGLCEAVVAALSTFVQCDMVVQFGTRTILRMCSDTDNVARFAAAGAMATLSAAAELHEMAEIEETMQVLRGERLATSPPPH